MVYVLFAPIIQISQPNPTIRSVPSQSARTTRSSLPVASTRAVRARSLPYTVLSTSSTSSVSSRRSPLAHPCLSASTHPRSSSPSSSSTRTVRTSSNASSWVARRRLNFRQRLPRHKSGDHGDEWTNKKKTLERAFLLNGHTLEFCVVALIGCCINGCASVG